MGGQPIGLMDVDAVWAAIHQQRLELADLLDDLSSDEWDHPSLCTGWRVRDVAAHLALAHTGPGRAALELIRAGGSLPRLIRTTAVRHAALPTERIVAEIRGMAGSRRRAVGVSPLEPLLDVLVHGQDVAVPLGRPRAMPVDAAGHRCDARLDDALADVRDLPHPRPVARTALGGHRRAVVSRRGGDGGRADTGPAAPHDRTQRGARPALRLGRSPADGRGFLIGQGRGVRCRSRVPR